MAKNNLLKEEVISLAETPALKDYRRNDLVLLICDREHIPKQLIYTRPYEDDEMIFNPVEILKDLYAPLSKIRKREEHVYIGLCTYMYFHPYEKIL